MKLRLNQQTTQRSRNNLKKKNPKVKQVKDYRNLNGIIAYYPIQKDYNNKTLTEATNENQYSN